MERVQQDHITLRNTGLLEQEAYSFDKIVYPPIPDTTVRLANLRWGDLDMVERLEPTDVQAAKGDPNLRIGASGWASSRSRSTSPMARSKKPMGKDKRVRQAFELSIDRDAINQVVFAGRSRPATSPSRRRAPTSQGPDPDPQARRREGQGAPEEEAGVKTPVKFEVTMSNCPRSQAVMQVIQSMAAEAGFDIQLRATEFATMLNEGAKGDFVANHMAGRAGRIPTATSTPS